MMVTQNLTDELAGALTLAQVAKLYPIPVSPQTVYRHGTVGIHGEVLRIWNSAGRLVTTRAALNDFLRRVDAARNAKRGQLSPQAVADEVAANGRAAAQQLAAVHGV